MPLHIYDLSNTNLFHRRALIRATNAINESTPNDHKFLIVVGTRNMIKALPKTLFGSYKTIVNIVGFGRLYSDYWIIGRFIFNLIVWFYDRTTARAFIVEHDVDKALLERFVHHPVFTTHGSGLDTQGFTRKRKAPGKIIQIGYLSRFDDSKGSHEVLKAAQNLPDDRHLIIAGWDIKSDRYSKKFFELAQEKSNVTFLGRIHSRPEISQFFNQIDLFLSPSVREGGNIALQEAIWHGIPFLTTDAPGCQVLANMFGCPALRMCDFGNAVINFDAKNIQTCTRNWDEKLKPFKTAHVETEYKTILQAVLNRQ